MLVRVGWFFNNTSHCHDPDFRSCDFVYSLAVYTGDFLCEKEK